MVSEFKGSSFGGPLKIMKENQDATREVLGIPYDFFGATLDASQTATDLVRPGSALVSLTMQYGGYVLGMSYDGSANFTAVPPTFTLQKNGVDTTLTLTPATGVTTAQTTEVDDYDDAIRFERGDLLSVVYDSAAGLLPDNTVNALVTIWVG